MDARGLFVSASPLPRFSSNTSSHVTFSKQKIWPYRRAKMTPFAYKKRVSLTAL
jgi:hypothetical protein